MSLLCGSGSRTVVTYPENSYIFSIEEIVVLCRALCAGAVSLFSVLVFGFFFCCVLFVHLIRSVLFNVHIKGWKNTHRTPVCKSRPWIPKASSSGTTYTQRFHHDSK